VVVDQCLVEKAADRDRHREPAGRGQKRRFERVTDVDHVVEMDGPLRTACRRYCERAQSHGDEDQKPPHKPAPLSCRGRSLLGRPCLALVTRPPSRTTLLLYGRNVKLAFRSSSGDAWTE